MKQRILGRQACEEMQKGSLSWLCNELGDQMCAESEHHVFTVTASGGAKQKEDDADEGGWGVGEKAGDINKFAFFLSSKTMPFPLRQGFFERESYFSKETLRQRGFSRMPASLLFKKKKIKFFCGSLFPALSSMTEQHLRLHILSQHKTVETGSDV